VKRGIVARNAASGIAVALVSSLAQLGTGAKEPVFLSAVSDGGITWMDAGGAICELAVAADSGIAVALVSSLAQLGTGAKEPVFLSAVSDGGITWMDAGDALCACCVVGVTTGPSCEAVAA